MAAATLKLAFILSATDKMSRIVDEAVKKSTDKLSSFERRTSKIGRSMMQAGTVMTGAGAAVGGALFSAAKSASNYGDEMWKTSQKVGIGVEEWQKLAYAAKYSDVEVTELTSGMAKFNKKIVEAAGGSKTAGRTFSDLGIKLKDAGGKLRAPNEIFEEFAEIFNKTEDGPAKTALAMEAFGKSGANLIPLLNTGKDGLKSMGDEAERAGFIMKAQTAKACEEFNDNLARVTNGAKGAVFQLGGALIPTLDKVFQKVTAQITKITEWATANPKLMDTIAKVWLVLAGLLVTVGSTAIAIGAITFVAGQFIKAFRGVSTAINVGKAIMNAAKNSMLLFRIQYGALVVWGKLCATAQWLFNSSLFACPIVWIVAGIMAVIAAVVLLVKNWDKVAGFFAKLWTNIKNIFGAAWDWIKNLFLTYHPVGIVISHWDKISAVFVKIWDKVKGVFSATWDWIKNLFLKYHPIGILISNWDKVVEWFGQMWNGIKSVFSNSWQGIADFFTGLPIQVFEWGKNIIQGLWNGITSMVDKVVNGIKNVGRKIANGFKSIFGINSPSKLFAGYGINLTQGLVVGINSGGNAVESAAGGMASRVTSGITQNMQNSTVDASSIINGGNSGVNFNYSPQITFSGPITSETRDEFSKMLRQHANDIIAIIRRDADNTARLSFNA